MSLEPIVDERMRQSSVKRKTANPFYNEYFKFPATYDVIKESTLAFLTYDYDKFSRHKLIGEVRIDMSKVETSNSVEMWCDIQKLTQVIHSSMDGGGAGWGFGGGRVGVWWRKGGGLVESWWLVGGRASGTVMS